MTTSCNVVKSIYRNACSTKLGERRVLSGKVIDAFQKDSNGKPIYQDICSNIGNGEWATVGVSNESKGNLTYCTETNEQTVMNNPGNTLGSCSSCPHGNAAIGGGYPICERIAFTADPWTCINNNMSQLGYSTIPTYPNTSGDPSDVVEPKLGQAIDTDLCFETNDQTRTCAPQYRDLSLFTPNTEVSDSGGSLGTISDMCTTGLNSLDEMIQAWNPYLGDNNSGTCVAILAKYLFGQEPEYWNPGAAALISGYTLPENQVNPSDSGAGQIMMQELFSQYQKLGYDVLARPGYPGYEPASIMSTRLFNMCTAAPIACQASLSSQVCPVITAAEVQTDGYTRGWCGCHMSPEQYTKYTKFSIDVSCTPFCAAQNVIPIATSLKGSRTCEQNICIIDDVTIQIINSEVGSINISNICRGCGDSSSVPKNSSTTIRSTCNCQIGDANVRVINSRVGTSSNGQINVTQDCQGTLSCFKQTDDNQRVPVNCNYDGTADEYIQDELTQRNVQYASSSLFYIFLGWLIIFMIIFLIFFFLYSTGYVKVI